MEKIYLNLKNNTVNIDSKFNILNCLNFNRDYRIESILANIAKNDQTPASLEEKVFTIAAKKSGLETDLFNSIYQAYNKGLAAKDLMDSIKDEECIKSIIQLTAMTELVGKDSSMGKLVANTLDYAYVTSKLKALKIDLHRDLVTNNVAELKFLIQSQIIFPLITLKNSTTLGEQLHEFRFEKITGKIMIRMNNKYELVSKIMNEFEIDANDKQLTKMNNGKKEYWSYSGDQGFAAVNRFVYHKDVKNLDQIQTPKLLPVATLSNEEVKALKAQANKSTLFTDKQKKGMDCFVQVVMNPADHGQGILKDAINPFTPNHAGIRLIRKEGDVYKVYSTGFSTTKDQRKLRHSGLILSTGDGQPSIMDQDETRRSNGRIVTTIPTTSEAAEQILDSLNTYRKNAIRFNIAKQNCVKLTCSVLEQAGVVVKTKMRISEIFRQIILGQPTMYKDGTFEAARKFSDMKLLEKVSYVSQRILNIFLTPLFIVVEIFFQLLSFSAMLALGGFFGTYQPDHQYKRASIESSNENKKYRMEYFQSAFTLMKTFLNPEWGSLYYSNPLIRWQLSQQSTHVHGYTKPRLCIVPSEKYADQKADKKARERFEHIFNIAKKPVEESIETLSKATDFSPEAKFAI